MPTFSRNPSLGTGGKAAQGVMAQSLVDFEKKLEALGKRVGTELPVVMTRQVVELLFRGILDKTPIDTGSAKANWFISLGEPNTERLPYRQYGLAAAEQLALSRLSVLEGLQPGQQVWITNDVQNESGQGYIRELESGSGSPLQAPNGMVRISLLELQAAAPALGAQITAL